MEKKTDGDLHICRDYKIGAYSKICSDSYPIPNISALHVLDGIKFFANIDLKTTYHQIQIYDTFKEISTINTPIGLFRWIQLPYKVKIESAMFQKAIENVLRWYIKNIIYEDKICLITIVELELMH